jgi:hypothetical protein
MYDNSDIETLRDYHLRMEQVWDDGAWAAFKGRRMLWKLHMKVCDWMAAHHKKQAAKHKQPFRLG